MRTAVIVSVLAVVSAAPAQQTWDKTQLEMFEAMERRVVYSPRKYKPGSVTAFETAGGVRLDYQTGQGPQAAWLIPQAKGDVPERLWVFCGGNGTLALELAPIARATKFEADAFVLVDYPGYGECAGVPSPQAIRETMKAAVLAAAGRVRLDPEKHPEAVCVFGHSLGCAAALLAVEAFHLRAAVLVAPFTSTAEMARTKFGLPKDVPLRQTFDNRVGLAELAKAKGRAWVFHGDQDEVIPVDMSRTLGAEFPGTVALTVVAGGRHNDLFGRAKADIFAAMAAARKR